MATLLETAAALAEKKARLRRSLLFLAVTAEEKGLLSSRYFAAYPTVPPERMAANLNVDVFLPIYPLKSLIAYSVDESDLGDDLRTVAAKLGVAARTPGQDETAAPPESCAARRPSPRRATGPQPNVPGNPPLKSQGPGSRSGLRLWT